MPDFGAFPSVLRSALLVIGVTLCLASPAQARHDGPHGGPGSAPPAAGTRPCSGGYTNRMRKGNGWCSEASGDGVCGSPWGHCSGSCQTSGGRSGESNDGKTYEERYRCRGTTAMH